MKKILLTGCNGFIGSHLYSHLEGQAAVTSNDYSNGSIEKDFINLDLTDTDRVNYYVANCDHYDVLIFLVGLAHAKGKGKDLSEFRNINYQTLVNLLSSLEKEKKLPGKLIFASTISVYGENCHQSIYDEDSGKNPVSPYAVTKLEAEKYLLDKYANKSWILRFAPVYSSSFLLNIIRRTKILYWFFKVGDGKRQLSLCNIKNIMTVIEEIINEKVPAGVYNISDNSSYNYNELLKWQGGSYIIRIPKIIVQLLFYCGKLFGNIFLQENSIKLLTDNIYPNEKIKVFVELPHTLKGMHLVSEGTQ